MEVGEVRISEDKDFQVLHSLVDIHDGWKLDYKKSNTMVWTREPKNSNFKMIKLHAIFKDIRPATVFDVLLDGEFRTNWDSQMLESYDVGYLDDHNDVGYYAAKCPRPLKSRDFVLQRSWQHTEYGYSIMNHSVYHESLPPKPGFIRGTSYITGYTIRMEPSGGSKVAYVTQTDPRGSLPAWVVNKLTKVFVPKMVKRLYKACVKYPSWKDANSPLVKPWIYPEQMALPRIDTAMCEVKGDSYSSSDWEEINLEDDENAGQIKEFLEDDDD